MGLLVNLLQALVETLMFFNPAVWYFSALHLGRCARNAATTWPCGCAASLSSWLMRCWRRSVPAAGRLPGGGRQPTAFSYPESAASWARQGDALADP